MSDLDEWYSALELVKQHLISIDPLLQQMFATVDKSGFQLHTVIKDPYTALIGAIIGQKISYTAARNHRRTLYERYATPSGMLIPVQMMTADLSFLSSTIAMTIVRVTSYILEHNIDLNTEDAIRSLEVVQGIGPWTIQTTLLTCLKNWDIFPEGDKFLHRRLQRLYGTQYDFRTVTSKWAPYRSVVAWYMWRWF